jgi:hypothetical protein
MKKLNIAFKSKDPKRYFLQRPMNEYQWDWMHQGRPPIGLHISMFVESMFMFTTDE